MKLFLACLGLITVTWAVPVKRECDYACPDMYAPVCGEDRDTYSNECDAGCSGVARSIPGTCEYGGDNDIHYAEYSCPCLSVFDPVCGSDRHTYSSECVAECNEIYQTISGYCDIGNDAYIQLIRRDDAHIQPIGNGAHIQPVRRDDAHIQPIGDGAHIQPVRRDDAHIQPIGDGAHIQPVRRDDAHIQPIGDGAHIQPVARNNAECNCNKKYEPVCGSHGGDLQTFNNLCMARCNHVTRTVDGRCEDLAFIQPVRRDDAHIQPIGDGAHIQPVRRDDAHIQPIGDGAHIQPVARNNNDCGCNRKYVPVCGANLRTYDNLCIARCNRMTRTRPGAC